MGALPENGRKVKGPDMAVNVCARIPAMLVRDEADLVAYLTDRPSQAVFVLRGAGDDDTAMAALRRAADAVRAIPHPDEPDDPLPNWVDALLGDDGPTLHLDMQDHAEQAPRVIPA